MKYIKRKILLWFYPDIRDTLERLLSDSRRLAEDWGEERYWLNGSYEYHYTTKAMQIIDDLKSKDERQSDKVAENKRLENERIIKEAKEKEYTDNPEKLYNEKTHELLDLYDRRKSNPDDKGLLIEFNKCLEWLKTQDRIKLESKL